MPGLWIVIGSKNEDIFNIAIASILVLHFPNNTFMNGVWYG